MNPFENPKNIIERESLENLEKEDSKESAKTLDEKIDEIKNSLKDLRASEKTLSDKIDNLLENLDANDSYDQNVLKISDLHEKLTTVQFKINKSLDSLKNLNSANNELQDFDKIETRN